MRSHTEMGGDGRVDLGGGENAFFLLLAFLSQLSCCLSLPICCLNATVLEAHQPGSVSCYRREVKRLFQLLSYWPRPPSGQARPSVTPAGNEGRSLPTEEVSLWVCVTCPPLLTRQIGSTWGLWLLAHVFCICVLFFTLLLPFSSTETTSCTHAGTHAHTHTHTHTHTHIHIHTHYYPDLFLISTSHIKSVTNESTLFLFSRLV